MSKYLAIVVLRKTSMGCFVSHVEFAPMGDETKSLLKESAERHVQELIKTFPEFNDAEFSISFHETYL